MTAVYRDDGGLPDEDNEEDFLFLIRKTVQNFDIRDDLDSWDRAEQEFKRLQAQREQVLDESQDVLRSLSRKLELARQSSDAARDSATNREISQQITELDRDKFSLVKTINELEQAIASSQRNLDQLEQQLKDVNNEDVIQEAADEYLQSSAVLKLKIFRTLGITLNGSEQLPEGSNEFEAPTQALIQSSSPEGKVHVFPLDSKYSSHFITNYLWEHL